MHSYTVSEVAADDFDLSLLTVSSDETASILNKISAIRKDLEIKKKNNPPGNTYYYVTDGEVLDVCDFLNDQHYISMIFSSSYLTSVSFTLGNRNYPSWVLSSRIGSWIAHNSSLAKKALFSGSTDESIKSNIINNNLVEVEDLMESVRNKSALSFLSNIQERLLEITNPVDAEVFVDSDYDKIRLLAYQKIGPMSHLDDLIKDPHALLRKYAVRLLSPGDQRLASFINDRSQDVFIQALSKISVSLIPMMLGSSHLKKKRVKDILNQRIQSAQS
jgi:hypothetical protein